MQGKKDGLRIALALLGAPEMIAFNHGNGDARVTRLTTRENCNTMQGMKQQTHPSYYRLGEGSKDIQRVLRDDMALVQRW